MLFAEIGKNNVSCQDRLTNLLPYQGSNVYAMCAYYVRLPASMPGGCPPYRSWIPVTSFALASFRGPDPLENPSFGPLNRLTLY